jgi:predicted small secreted protein
MNRMQSFRILLAAGLVASLLTACNTVKGAGRDIESVGRAGERVIN